MTVALIKQNQPRQDLIQQEIISDMSLGGDIEPQVLDGMLSQRAAVYQGFNDDFSPEAFHQWVLQHGVNKEI